MKTNNMKEMMVRLAEVEANGSPVVTCMVNLTQTHYAAAEEIERQSIEAGRGVGEDQRGCYEEAVNRIKSYLKETAMPEASGAVIYCRGGGEPFLMALPTGVSFETSLVADELPHLYPLVETRDTYHRFVVVTLSAREAHIYETVAGTVTNEIMTERPDLREKIGREWTRERYQNHKDDRKNRFIQSKIEVVEELMTKRGHNHLIVAGSPKMVSRFTNALPLKLKSKLVDTLDVNLKAGINPIVVEAIESFVAREHEESHDQVKRLESAIMSRGLGVAGEDEVRQAIEHGYADLLIIDQDYHDPVAKENLVRMALGCGVEIETVKESEKLTRLSGVGALLRYRPTYHPDGVNKDMMLSA